VFILRTSEGRGCPLGNENGVKLDYIYTRAGLLRKLDKVAMFLMESRAQSNLSRSRSKTALLVLLLSMKAT
jgi:hypothetical protein